MDKKIRGEEEKEMTPETRQHMYWSIVVGTLIIGIFSAIIITNERDAIRDIEVKVQDAEVFKSAFENDYEQVSVRGQSGLAWVKKDHEVDCCQGE